MGRVAPPTPGRLLGDLADADETSAAFCDALFKGGFGVHPLLWLDTTNEALAGLLRPGNAGANTRRRPHRGH
jgi:hypothetical protein